jgi:hypothetical protein
MNIRAYQIVDPMMELCFDVGGTPLSSLATENDPTRLTVSTNKYDVPTISRLTQYQRHNHFMLGKSKRYSGSTPIRILARSLISARGTWLTEIEFAFNFGESDSGVPR